MQHSLPYNYYQVSLNELFTWPLDTKFSSQKLNFTAVNIYCGLRPLKVLLKMTDGDGSSFMEKQPISDLCDELSGIIYSVWELEDRLAEENMTGEQIKAVLTEVYSPATLFSASIRSVPGIYPALRN